MHILCITVLTLHTYIDHHIVLSLSPSKDLNNGYYCFNIYVMYLLLVMIYLINFLKECLKIIIWLYAVPLLKDYLLVYCNLMYMYFLYTNYNFLQLFLHLQFKSYLISPPVLRRSPG